MSPVTLAPPRVARLPFRPTVPVPTGASLAISPYSVPVDFRGQDFELTFVNGRAELLPGTRVLLHANFWLADSIANQVELAANRTGARLELSVGDRTVEVEIRAGRVAPGERFTVRVRAACSLVSRTPANDRAFAAVVARPTAECELVETVKGGWMEPLAAAAVHAAAPSRVRKVKRCTPGVASDTVSHARPPSRGRSDTSGSKHARGSLQATVSAPVHSGARLSSASSTASRTTNGSPGRTREGAAACTAAATSGSIHPPFTVSTSS
ncbi:MAG TPA: hypothetical protein VFX98_01040, partial [Longimicrobiaceae bacterium]|nr:hypothetical protein [Longimicrobiaceae bacterium]